MTGFPDPAGEAAWRAAVARVLKGEGFDARLVARTLDGIPVRPLYPAAEAPGPAGARPPVRIFGRLDAAEASALDELENGADGLVILFDGAPAARGFGLDPAALGGALEGLDLDLAPLRLEPAPFAGLDALRALLDVAEARRVPASALDLDAGIDPIGFTACTGEAPKPWPELAPLLADIVGALLDQGLGGRLLRADGRPHHEAGASEAQELAAALATAVAYLRALEAGGMPLAAARGHLSFTLAVDADLFLGLAKLRALRRLWARVEESCGLDPRPVPLHVETSWRMLARRDPPTNLLRNAVACAGAMLGGADGLSVLPHTAPLGLADPFARRLARNTALVLREEAGLDRVADPGAGAGAVEALTEALCAEAWDLFAEIDGAGGLPAALADRSWAARLSRTREGRAADLAAGRRAILGTTAYALPAEPPAAVLRPAPEAPPRAGGALPSLRDDEGWTGRPPAPGAGA